MENYYQNITTPKSGAVAILKSSHKKKRQQIELEISKDNDANGKVGRTPSFVKWDSIFVEAHEDPNQNKGVAYHELQKKVGDLEQELTKLKVEKVKLEIETQKKNLYGPDGVMANEMTKEWNSIVRNLIPDLFAPFLSSPLLFAQLCQDFLQSSFEIAAANFQEKKSVVMNSVGVSMETFTNSVLNLLATHYQDIFKFRAIEFSAVKYSFKTLSENTLTSFFGTRANSHEQFLKTLRNPKKTGVNIRRQTSKTIDEIIESQIFQEVLTAIYFFFIRLHLIYHKIEMPIQKIRQNHEHCFIPTDRLDSSRVIILDPSNSGVAVLFIPSPIQILEDHDKSHVGKPQALLEFRPGFLALHDNMLHKQNIAASEYFLEYFTEFLNTPDKVPPFNCINEKSRLNFNGVTQPNTSRPNTVVPSMSYNLRVSNIVNKMYLKFMNLVLIS